MPEESNGGMLAKNDHDLLVGMHATMGRAVSDIRDLTKSMGGLENAIATFTTAVDRKILEAVTPKLDKSEFEKIQKKTDESLLSIEKKADFATKMIYLAMGGFAVVQLLVLIFHK